jgi:RNA-binding signal recognition particle 68
MRANFLRCILIARSHTLLKDHVSALALYEKAQAYLSKISKSLGSLPEKDIPVTKVDVTTLISLLQGEMTRSHAHVILSQPSSHESTYFQTVLSCPPLSSFYLTAGRNHWCQGCINSHDPILLT